MRLVVEARQEDPDLFARSKPGTASGTSPQVRLRRHEREPRGALP